MRKGDQYRPNTARHNIQRNRATKDQGIKLEMDSISAGDTGKRENGQMAGRRASRANSYTQSHVLWGQYHAREVAAAKSVAIVYESVVFRIRVHLSCIMEVRMRPVAWEDLLGGNAPRGRD